jgi:hypothetical protein
MRRELGARGKPTGAVTLALLTPSRPVDLPKAEANKSETGDEGGESGPVGPLTSVADPATRETANEDGALERRLRELAEAGR